MNYLYFLLLEPERNALVLAIDRVLDGTVLPCHVLVTRICIS